MKTVIVLSGGGLKTSYQHGVMQSLLERGVTFDCIIGTSGGAINGYFYATDQVKQLNEYYFRLNKYGTSELFSSKFINPNTFKLNFWYTINKVLPRIGLKLFTKKGRKHFTDRLQENLENIESIANSRPLEDKLAKSYKKPIIDFYCNFVSLDTGKEVVTSFNDYKSIDNFIKSIVASASIPVFLNPVKYITTKTSTYFNCVDGGIASNSNISYAYKYISEQENPNEWRIICINCHNEDLLPEKNTGIVNTLKRTVLDIMLNKLYNKDLKNANLINYVVKRKKNKTLQVGNKNLRFNRLTIIEPIVGELGKTLENSGKLFLHRYNLGKQDGKQAKL